MNLVGLLAFAVAGSLKGADADLDPFGVATLGVLTALGGGTIRDVLVGRVPAALRSTGDVLVVLAGVGVGLLVAWALSGGTGRVRDHPAFLVADAVGLAAFAASGAAVGADAGLSAFGIVVTATLTGVGGGSLSDLLLARVPVVLREDVYATPALLGGVAYVVAAAVGVRGATATLGVAVGVFALRVVAVRRGWSLPRV
ncbi:trimeric intracellular cation channel family protein [Halobaculum rubrum]|uniref:trimeric intracellular cation channel family protein n=1 Tax=Halobaculum rubrum TaxID=2872158 RepID=UPI001CA38836|nr:TRIC cation channel family protein [Halobaculum rubrum]QZY00972.1 TRIC cation channel family protein [Halobaculum rubrum]